MLSQGYETTENMGNVKLSPTLKYTTMNVRRENYFYGTLGIEIGSTPLSYPVFKPNTYAYNLISLGDAYLLSKEIDSATSMYGLSNVDSHLQKNSEWGAVAYLTHSGFGVDGSEANKNEVAINATNASNYVKKVYAVTSKNSDIGASSTGNITGVFDLNGGILEMTAGFLKGGECTDEPASHNAMVTKDTTASNEYVTIYEASYSSNNKIGDAIRETSTTGSSSTGWNSDNSTYGTSTVPGFLRGGAYNYSTGAGIFAFTRTAGTVNDQYGFRVCLAF